MIQKTGKPERLGQPDRRMGKALRAKPVVIADRTVPRVANKGKREEGLNLGIAGKARDIGQRRMFPQPSVGFDPVQSPLARARLGRIPDQHILLHRAGFEGEGKRRAAGLGNMHEDIFAPARQDHGLTCRVVPSLAPSRGRGRLWCCGIGGGLAGKRGVAFRVDASGGSIWPR